MAGQAWYGVIQGGGKKAPREETSIKEYHIGIGCYPESKHIREDKGK